MYKIYKKHIITVLSILVLLLLFIMIYKSYKISKIKNNITNLPIIRSEIEIIKIKKDNRELKDMDVNSFYKNEEIDEKNLEKKNLDNTINNIVAINSSDYIKENKTIDDIIEQKNIDSDEKQIEIDKNIKKLIVNEKEEDTITEEDLKKQNNNFYKAQLIALKNQQQAKIFIDNTRKLYTNLLKDLNIFIVKIDLKEKGIFYRVQVGNFNTKEDASNFCKEYIKLGNKNITNCIVIK